MQIKNTDNRYGIISIFLHWIMAALIIGLILLGLYMQALPISEKKLQLYGWHKELGILVLMLFVIRIIWRLSNIVPLLPSSIPDWQKLAAHAMHWCFYGLMLVVPVTGWLVTSAAGLPVAF